MADGPCSDSNQVSVGTKSVRIDSDDKNHQIFILPAILYGSIQSGQFAV